MICFIPCNQQPIIIWPNSYEATEQRFQPWWQRLDPGPLPQLDGMATDIFVHIADCVGSQPQARYSVNGVCEDIGWWRVMRYGGFHKWWVSPTNHGVFLLKMIILGCEMGVPPFKETPIYEMNIDSPPNWKLGIVFSLIKLVILLMDKNPAFSSWYGSLRHYLQGFWHDPRWCLTGFLNHPTVVAHEKKIWFDAGPCGCLMSSHVSASRA